MKKILVEVCAGTECVMKGSMDIIESVESLNKLKNQLRLNAQVDIVACGCLGGCKSGKLAPIVRVNGTELCNANSETVMANIISLTKDVNN